MSAVGLVGGVLSLGGTLAASAAQQKMVAQQTSVSQQAENVRSQQMQLDAQRKRRQAVRQSLLARSMAVTNGANQGALMGSGVQSAKGTATASGLESQETTNAATILGQRSFDLNKKYFDVTQKGQAAIGVGEGIASFGNVLMQQGSTITSLGQDYF